MCNFCRWQNGNGWTAESGSVTRTSRSQFTVKRLFSTSENKKFLENLNILGYFKYSALTDIKRGWSESFCNLETPKMWAVDKTSPSSQCKCCATLLLCGRKYQYFQKGWLQNVTKRSSIAAVRTVKLKYHFKSESVKSQVRLKRKLYCRVGKLSQNISIFPWNFYDIQKQ